MRENKDRASDGVIRPRSPTGKALSDADSAASVLALSLARQTAAVRRSRIRVLLFSTFSHVTTRHLPAAVALQGSPGF